MAGFDMGDTELEGSAWRGASKMNRVCMSSDDAYIS